MQPIRPSKPSDPGRSPGRLLLSFGLPLLLLLAFLGKQFIDFDSIGWSNGFSHPLTGWDHLVTMLAVGIWAAQLRGQAVWMLPLAFVGVMSLGGLAGASGLAIPSVEGIILLSCAVFSVLITRRVRFSAKVNVLIVAFFAFFHGYAHGQEISTSASLISYTLGFMLATLLLHGAGILAAKLVVLSVTCLLTIIFSNAALAKTAEPSVDEHIENRVLTQKVALRGPASFRLAEDMGGGGALCFAKVAEKLPPDNFSRHCNGLGSQASVASKAIGPGSAGWAKAPPKSYGQEIKADCNADGLLVKQACVPAADKGPEQGLLNLQDTNHSRLGFRHYFPDINHTPGKQLLSNGVGLTSPPQLFPNALAPQVSPNLHTSLIPSIEESDLQSIIAEFDAGKPFSKTPNDFSPDCVFHDPGRALYFGITTVPRLIQSLSYPAPIASPAYRCGALPGLYPLFAGNRPNTADKRNFL